MDRIQYKLDARKISNIEDIKLIFERMDISFTPGCNEDYEMLKHLLIHPGKKNNEE